MRALILSDIHANLEALESVLEAARGQWDELWNLGDLVGYGGSPNQVIDLVRPLEAVVVRGNHDRVCCGLTSPNGFNPTARAAAMWTRNELSPVNLAWLREVPQGPIHPVQPAHPGITCVHGSPLDEDSYILNMRDAWAPLQQMSTPITFFGHTHIQGGFSQNAHEWQELRPTQHPANSNGATPIDGDPNRPVSYTVQLPPAPATSSIPAPSASPATATGAPPSPSTTPSLLKKQARPSPSTAYPTTWSPARAASSWAASPSASPQGCAKADERSSRY